MHTYVNPGLALIDLRKTRPWIQHINLARAHDPNKTQHLVSGNLKSVISMIHKVEFAIWSHDTG